MRLIYMSRFVLSVCSGFPFPLALYVCQAKSLSHVVSTITPVPCAAPRLGLLSCHLSGTHISLDSLTHTLSLTHSLSLSL